MEQLWQLLVSSIFAELSVYDFLLSETIARNYSRVANCRRRLTLLRRSLRFKLL